MWEGFDIYALFFIPCFRLNHDVQITSPIKLHVIYCGPVELGSAGLYPKV